MSDSLSLSHAARLQGFLKEFVRLAACTGIIFSMDAFDLKPVWFKIIAVTALIMLVHYSLEKWKTT